MKTSALNHVARALVAAAAAALLAGCNSGDATAPPTTPAGEQAAAAQPTPPADKAPEAKADPPPAPEAVEASPLAAGAPFEVTVKGPATPPDKGDLELSVVIDVAAELKVPTDIDVVVPKGATLTSGQTHETLASLAKGQLTRTYKLSVSGKLTEPVRILVEAKNPSGKSGVRAEKLYPEAAPTPYNKPYSNGVPPPPVGRPGAAPPKTK